MKAGKFIRKYNHIWTLLYIVFYMPWFMWLEKTVTTDFHLVSMPIDYKIPFCEYFIIPYFMWFLFVPAIVGYEFFYSKKEYYQCCAYLFSGMTIFLIICTVWHNGLNLRQDISYNNNLCARLVKMLYKTDTSTNVFPSLHVFNTLGCLVALYRSKGMKDKAWIKVIATIIGIIHDIFEAAFGVGCHRCICAGSNPLSDCLCDSLGKSKTERNVITESFHSFLIKQKFRSLL